MTAPELCSTCGLALDRRGPRDCSACSSGGTSVRVLDHGSIRIVEAWGSDQAIIEAARQSTQKGFLGWGPKGWRCQKTPGGVPCGWTGDEDPKGACPRCGDCVVEGIPGDEKLLRFLWENAHSTPFEFAGMTVEVEAPIMVFREWHRHRVPFGYSEASARYAPLPDLSYVPDVADAVERSKAAAASANKQAGAVKGAPVLTQGIATALLNEERALLERIEDLYQRKLAAGFTKELARTHLTISRYSKMRATGNLRGWLAFLKLRDAPTAQKEIRLYASALHGFLRERFPRTLALFDEGGR